MKVAKAAASILLSFAFAQTAFAQVPAPDFDVYVPYLTYTHLPGDSAIITAQVGLAKVDSIGPILTDVQFYLDGQPVGSVQYDVTATPQGGCEQSSPPNCGGLCPPAEINGQIVTTYICLKTPWVIGDRCACAYLVEKHIIVIGPAPQTAGATVDPGDLYTESDETNNSMTIAVGPTPVLPKTWGTIKGLYR